MSHVVLTGPESADKVDYCFQDHERETEEALLKALMYDLQEQDAADEADHGKTSKLLTCCSWQPQAAVHQLGLRNRMLHLYCMRYSFTPARVQLSLVKH